MENFAASFICGKLSRSTEKTKPMNFQTDRYDCVLWNFPDGMLIVMEFLLVDAAVENDISILMQKCSNNLLNLSPFRKFSFLCVLILFFGAA